MPQSSNLPSPDKDQLIRDLLADGTLAADLTTGQIRYNGRPRGSAGPDGSVRVAAWINGRQHCLLAHRIVAIAAGMDIGGLEVNHRNRDRTDNRAANLEPVTHVENIHHARDLWRYNRERPEDVDAVDPDWLAQMRAAAAAGLTRQQLAEMLDRDTPGRAPRELYRSEPPAAKARGNLVI